MKDRETIRTTFAQDTKMTPEIVSGITTLVKDSLSTFKERNEKGKILYEKLVNALKKQKKLAKSANTK